MMKRKPRLGQVFLTDRRYIGKIDESLDIDGETVVEIGPGRGQLTGALSCRAAHVYCVELDRRLARELSGRRAPGANVTVINADILDFNFFKIPSKAVVVGNVPYYISKKLINYLIANRRFIKRAYLTFQREFAEKLAARPGGGVYSPLSCLIQYYARVEALFSLPAKAFSPRPAVDSSLVRFQFYSALPHRARSSSFLSLVINQAFSQRRKKLQRLIPESSGKLKLLGSLGINPDARPQELSIADYVRLANKLYPHRDGLRLR